MKPCKENKQVKRQRRTLPQLIINAEKRKSYACKTASILLFCLYEVKKSRRYLSFEMDIGLMAQIEMRYKVFFAKRRHCDEFGATYLIAYLF